MNVLFISHSSVVDVYQDKLRYLGRRPDVNLSVLLPSVYREGTRLVEAWEGSGEYKVIKRPTLAGRYGRQNMYLFMGLPGVIAMAQPDIIHIEEEPSSLVTRQIIRCARRQAPQARIVLFTWQNLVYDYSTFSPFKPQRYIQPRVERFVLKKLDFLIGGNQEALEIFSEKGCAAPQALIPQYGVDPRRFGRRPANPALKAKHNLRGKVIGYVGRMLKMKGIDTLLRALQTIDDRDDWTMLFLGSGPDKESFQALAEKLGIAARIRWVQSVPAADVVQYFNAIDMLVLPSLTTDVWKEQFGRVLIEAMMCGVPAIGSNSGEIPNVIGEGGLIFHEGDADQLAGRVTELLDDEQKRLALGEAGVKRVEQHYTNEVIADKIYDVYRRVVNTA